VSATDLLQLIESLPLAASVPLRKEVRSAYRVLEGLNPLEHLFFQASVLDQAWSGLLTDAPRHFDFGGLLADLHGEQPIQFLGKAARVHSIEDGGVLGAILWMQSQPGLEAVFGNDLAYTRLGLDLVARGIGGDGVVLCEAKGTMRAFATPGRYLRETRRKGRQLSWRWCWQSLTEFAMRGPTARLFLTTFRAVLCGRARRVLAVSQVSHRGRALVLGDTKTFSEDELAMVAGLDVSSDFSKWRKWLTILDSPDGQRRQRRLELLRTIMAEAYAGMENAAEIAPKARSLV
jgi:hypothetical protein